MVGDKTLPYTPLIHRGLKACAHTWFGDEPSGNLKAHCLSLVLMDGKSFWQE